MPALGFKIDARPAEDLRSLAEHVESAGFDQLWVCEDLGLAGGISQATLALAATDALDVGLGIAPAAVRNPAYLAMEFATLARMFPRRFIAGIGHGMPSWLEQVGELPVSLMACLAEVAEAVRDLTAGQTVTFSGRHVHLSEVALTHPPAEPAPISLGVRGPKGIELARRLGTGVILAEGSTPESVANVRRILGPAASITVFVWANIDDDGTRASEDLRPTVEAAITSPALAAQVGELHGQPVTRDVIRRLTVSGTAAECDAAIRALGESGADSVVLQSIHGREEAQAAAFGALRNS